ncbi:MAG: ImmA/IrrE family metallo-endopeptidase [Ethanoligenens sp.]
MTNLELLFKQAEENGISIYELPLDSTKSMIADLGNDNAAICLASSNIASEKEAEESVAHELGHFFTGTYYDSPYCDNNRGKMEHQANVWMVKKLLPPSAIYAAVADGCCEIWEISDYCDCTENLVKKAIEVYTQKGLL